MLEKFVLTAFAAIRRKLRAFIRRYYLRKLVQGVLYFTLLGFLLWFLLTGVEYFLWLGLTGRRVLFFLLLGGLIFLVVRYILFPLVQLWGLRRPLTEAAAARLIGSHFPEIGDKLSNLIDLSEHREQQELVLASIEQRSKRLQHFPFEHAISFAGLRKSLYLLLIPLGLLLLIWGVGVGASWLGSFQRVANYDLAYERPAPFRFQLLNDALRIREGEALEVRVAIQGEERPERVFLNYGGSSFEMLEHEGVFKYTLRPTLQQEQFHFMGSGVISQSYFLEVLSVPVMQDLRMRITEPAYLGGAQREVNGSGNARVPEGSTLYWDIGVANTDEVHFRRSESLLYMERSGDRFQHRERVFRSFSYEISSSNAAVREYEKLNYQVTVIPDRRPEIRMRLLEEDAVQETVYFSGAVSDDQRVNAVFLKYRRESEEEARELELYRPQQALDSFYYTFPSGLELEQGVDYTVWFEAEDNDGIRGGKRARSQEFRLGLRTQEAQERRELEVQKEGLRKLEKELRQIEQQEKSLQEFQEEGKQKQTLNYRDRERLRDLLKEQERQESLMQRFSRDMKEQLEEKEQEQDPLLQERLERREAEARKNEALLKELQKVIDKLDPEALKERLEQLGKQQQKGNRDLRQLLELTKRFYVQEAVRQLSRDFERLSREQEALAQAEAATDSLAREQQALREETRNRSQALDSLLQDNKALHKPMDLPRNVGLRKEIDAQQGKAGEQLKNKQREAGRAPQENAAKGLKKLAEQLGESNAASSSEALEEDAEMLRQILDNLLRFSFQQEALFEEVSMADPEVSPLGASIRKEQELYELFEHVDDSLFTLSLRRAELSELVNEQVGEVYYNMDKALESLSENQIYQGAAHQQYVITAANTLADFLANLLGQMQQQLQMGSGAGEQADFQLPDIIQSQQQLQERMQGSGKQGEKGQKQGEGESDSGEQSGEKGPQQQGQGESGEGEGKGEQPGESGSQGRQGINEEGFGEVYEIYQEQQQIRQRLEEQLEDLMDETDRQLARRLAQQMEQFERELIRSGINERTTAMMDHIRQQLWKLEDAAMLQGEEEERESQRPQQRFQGPILTKPVEIEEISSELEEIERQALPLRREIQERVNAYFRKND